MAFEKSMTKGVASDSNINDHFKSLLSKYLDTMNSSGKDLEDIPHNKPASNGSGYSSLTSDSPLMTWTQMLEAMDAVSDSMENPAPEDAMDEPIEGPSNDVDEKALLDQLNKLFTPVLVMQGYEKDMASQANNEMAESGILTEQNVISFDDETRMSQLISVCAKLIARQKNTESWQMYQKAAAIKKQASINIQKEEYDQAKQLAQKYLVSVSTTNNSSVARNAANDLLPQTNH